MDVNRLIFNNNRYAIPKQLQNYNIGKIIPLLKEILKLSKLRR